MNEKDGFGHKSKRKDLKAKTDRIKAILEGRCEPLLPDKVADDKAFRTQLAKDTTVTVQKCS